MRRGAVSLWGVRAAWIVTGASAWSLIESLDDIDPTDRWILAVTAGLVWSAAVIAIGIVSTAGLTTARALIPLSVPAAVALALATPVSVATFALVTGAVISTAVTLSAGFGAASVQASAYGDEVRCLLRPPVGYLLAALVAASIWTALVVGAGVTLGAGRRGFALGLGIAAVAVVTLAWPRWHRLSRRWLVLVPAGLVVHDPVVLADTIMLRRSTISGISLATADTTAIDLSGPSAGHLVEIRATGPQPLALAPARRGQAPRTAEATAFLVAPTRPGYALACCRDRRLPVGA